MHNKYLSYIPSIKIGKQNVKNEIYNIIKKWILMNTFNKKNSSNARSVSWKLETLQKVIKA